MKKAILINANGNRSWIGGLYYKKNIIFSLIQNKKITDEYEIVVMTDRENEELFKEFREKIKLIPNDFPQSKFLSRVAKLIFMKKLNVAFLYPSSTKWLKYLGIKCISWIPDFQHNYFPEYFDNKELWARTKKFREAVIYKKPVILSSNSAKQDFIKYYKAHEKNIFVMPFVSFIEPEIKRLNSFLEQNVLQKFGLTKKLYACINNQFWQHKNHLVVFKAIENLTIQYPELNLEFVFTGEMKDYRNTRYYNLLQEVIKNKGVKSRIKILGFIDRTEQLVIMKNANFIIQPSLFEGWGTVLEDAKVLDKLVLLSDIPIHREQKNENCFLFNPYDEKELSRLIIQVSQIPHEENISKGISNMYKRAQEYSESFERIIEV